MDKKRQKYASISRNLKEIGEKKDIEETHRLTRRRLRVGREEKGTESIAIASDEKKRSEVELNTMLPLQRAMGLDRRRAI